MLKTRELREDFLGFRLCSIESKFNHLGKVKPLGKRWFVHTDSLDNFSQKYFFHQFKFIMIIMSFGESKSFPLQNSL